MPEAKFSCIAGVGLNGGYSSSLHIFLYSGFDHYPILSTNQVNDIIILYINSSNKGMLILSNSGNRLYSVQKFLEPLSITIKYKTSETLYFSHHQDKLARLYIKSSIYMKKYDTIIRLIINELIKCD
jgi:hypothetical protein